MKKIALAAAFSMFGPAALAGGLDGATSDPVIAPIDVGPAIIESETGSAGQGWLVPVLMLLFVGAAAN